jgi:hypothetical protein
VTSSHCGRINHHDPRMPGLWHVVCGVYKPAESGTKKIVLSVFILLPIYRNRQLVSGEQDRIVFIPLHVSCCVGCDHRHQDIVACGDCQQLASEPVESWAIVIIGVMGNDVKKGDEGADGSGAMV